MITKKRRIAWAVALVLLAGLVICGVLVLSGPREPSYQGKSLSAWIVPFAKQTSAGVVALGGPTRLQSLEPVREAVRQMGTNAVPFLIARMNSRERFWHRKVRELAQKQRATALLLSDPAVGQIRAIRSLAVLGTNATAAIPGLVNHLTNNLTGSHAIYALASMGPDGVRELLNQMTNKNPAIRFRLQMEFLMRLPLSFEASNDPLHEPYVSALLQYMQDPEPTYRMQALGRLQMMGIMKAMTSNDTARVVPVLLSSLGDTNVGIRLMVVHTLESFHPPADMVLGTLTNYLTNSDLALRVTVASMLRRYGVASVPMFSVPPPPPFSHGRDMLPPPVQFPAGSYPRTNGLDFRPANPRRQPSDYPPRAPASETNGPAPAENFLPEDLRK